MNSKGFFLYLKSMLCLIFILGSVRSYCQSSSPQAKPSNIQQDTASKKRPKDNSGENTNNQLVGDSHQVPVYPGGDQGLLGDIMKNLRYPKTDQPLQGIVRVNFFIERTGDISNLKVIQGIRADYDSAAVYAVKKLSKFNSPGKIAGIPTRTKYSVPVTFYRQKAGK